MQMQTAKTFEEMERRNTRQSKGMGVVDEDAFQQKVDRSLELIADCLKASNNPICLTSYGKDSLVMLHMILSLRKVPVIYWREPFYQRKFKHAQEVAELWDLNVYDYPPSYVDYYQDGDYFDVYNFYNVGTNATLNLFTGCQNKEEGEFLCAIKDLIARPKVSGYEFKWDCIFHGHKQCDPAYITERLEVPRLKLFGNGIMAFPISDWSDAEIWQYIYKHDLPYNKERYDDINEGNNNDVFPTCHKCIDYRNVDGCICPKSGQHIDFIGKPREEHEKLRDMLLQKVYK